MRVEHLAGLERLAAMTTILQRARLTHDTAGIWDAADVQWWWRRPRPSDDVATPVWFDAEGPVAAVALTDWDRAWQVDAIVVPGTVELEAVWDRALDAAEASGAPSLEVLARDEDAELRALLARDGFRETDERSGTTWMLATDRPPVAPVPEGYRLTDRASDAAGPHPMRVRNGEEVEARLRQTSLYDPSLDLVVRTHDDDVAGYALFWFDDVTGVGMLEPMRVEDEHQRRGLARALLTEGLDRLAAHGARRLKVGFDGEAGRNLYLGAGFVLVSTDTTFRR
ncbi:MAG TPA: GNAT family N-acetyltransferase [Acidimicrobiales bacterium]|nr:GNAT family N-acetyltransferase [Acidimicrobiales bacterium]